MERQRNHSTKAHPFRSVPIFLSFLAVCVIPFVLAQPNSATESGQIENTPWPSPKRTLTFAERVAYQRAIEEVYWRHRIWPKENANPKPNLDQVMSASEIQKRVEDYLRKSQVLEDYWQRPITAEQLQSEMDRMAKQTRQPEMLRELFQALGNDPFITAECLARPALAERLLTSWYAYDQRIHGALKQRAETELHAHPAIDQMKQLSGKYSEVELVKSDSTQGEDKRSVGSVKLNSREWDETVQKLTAMLGDAKNNTNHTNILSHGARLAGDKAVFGTMTEIKVGVLSSLQEDEGHFYTAAVTGKTDDRVKLASVSWLKEPRESWLARGEEKARDAVAVTRRDYTLPKITEGLAALMIHGQLHPGRRTREPPTRRYGLAVK
jgi:hypothetical protein